MDSSGDSRVPRAEPRGELLVASREKTSCEWSIHEPIRLDLDSSGDSRVPWAEPRGELLVTYASQSVWHRFESYFTIPAPIIIIEVTTGNGQQDQSGKKGVRV